MKQKINLSLTLIALVAVLSAAFGITLVYYSLFQTLTLASFRLLMRARKMSMPMWKALPLSS